MRIAFLTPEYVTEKNFDGGLSNHLGRVCPDLVKMRHDVVVIVASDCEGTIMQDGVEVRRVATNPSVLSWINRLSLRKLPTSSRWLLQSWSLNRACAKLHQERPFDLIQYASYTATGLFRLKSVPAVIRVSSYEPLRQKAYELPPSWNHRLMGWMDKAAIRKADAVFGPSQLIADVVAKETGQSVEVIEPPFRLNRDFWDEQPYRDLLSGKKYLLFFGTMGVLKGVPAIAQIINQLLENHSDLFFVFIGKDGGYRGRPMIEHVWEKAGQLRGRVLYLGQMRHCQLYPILAHATTVVLPSRIDNVPNTCLEAMAFRRVVIGTRGASFEQLIADGESGFLCEIDSPPSLLESLERVLALPEEARTIIRENAGKRIETLNPEIAITRLCNFYQSVINP